MDIKKDEWDRSYDNRDNFVFYPHEEVIRFTSRFIRKRIEVDEFKDLANNSKPLRVLDLGCGIGRHVLYLHELGIEGYGIDLSGSALKVARAWALRRGITNPEKFILQGDIRNLPFSDRYFRFALSHGVLDSMPFDVARASVTELSRVIEVGGLFYCDLISGDDSVHAREYCGEETVTTRHEYNTIQSYFNKARIDELFEAPAGGGL